MPKHLPRKFVTPGFSGDKVSGENGDFKEKANSGSLSDSQYEEIFSEVIKKSIYKSNDSIVDDDIAEEDNVAIPEPDAALSPNEEAEEMNRDVYSNGSVVLTKTPKNPTDNSVLPPLKKKKPESRIKKLNLKLKPTRLNFDDPELMGKPDNVSKPLENDNLPKRNGKKYKMPKITSNSGIIENKKSLPDKEISKQKATSSKNTEENGERFVKPFVSPKFQSQQTATGKRAEQKKKSPCDDIIPSSNLSSVNNIGSLSLSQSTPKSFQFGSQESCSPGSKILSPRSRLFRLQKKRNVGLWVQCSQHNCSKWRYLANTCDPTEVPDKWQCYMNDDERYASCSAPERGPTPLEEEDLIHNIYTAGSLVWAHVAGYPWWPAMVDDDPDVEQYYWITEYCDIPTHYNVSFFDEKPVTRAWVTPSALTKYVGNEKRKDLLKMSANGIDYSHRIKVAIEQANEASTLSIDERLKKFSFVSRYKGPIGKKRQLLDSPETKRKKSKKSKREKKRDMTDSLNDSQASILRSLEVVKEVNEVLSQMSSDSESEGDEENPQFDLNKSLEEVNEINEVLDLLSDSESVGIDDDQLEEYLKSSQKEPLFLHTNDTTNSKKKLTSVDKERDRSKGKKEKRSSVEEKRKSGHSSISSKEKKSEYESSRLMDKKKDERKEKSKDRSGDSKSKKVSAVKDSIKEKSPNVEFSSIKKSEENLKTSHFSKDHGKSKDSFKKVEKGREKEKSLAEKAKETRISKEGMSDVPQKTANSDSKESGTKEKKSVSEKTNKKDEKRRKDVKSDDNREKQKKSEEKSKSKSSEKVKGITKAEVKEVSKDKKDETSKTISTSSWNESKDSPKSSKDQLKQNEKDGDEIVSDEKKKEAIVEEEGEEMEEMMKGDGEDMEIEVKGRSEESGAVETDETQLNREVSADIFKEGDDSSNSSADFDFYE